jgi:tRNA dimethylallyltransferase
MSNQPQKTIVLIAGPTASGKSALALRLAQDRNGVIINADSMQVYAELRILSARPSEEEERLAPQRLFGHVRGAEDYSVGRWIGEATREIEAAWADGKLPIICGGTGLYFMALEQGLSEVPAIAPEVRRKWREFDGDLYSELQARDPVMAERLKANDHQRIIRALEVIGATGRSLADWQGRGQERAFLNQINVERHFVNVPREALYDRAERRFDEMMAQGALAEVRGLPGLPPDRPMMRAIGVPELLSHLRGETSLDEAVAKAKTATRHYIKRQLTWWRGQGKAWTGETAA